MNFIQILIVIFGVIAVATVSISYASFFEWFLHKYVMHGKPFGFKYAYKGHHETHHVIFGAGKTYELKNHAENKRQLNKKTIPMAWWNWIVLLIFAVSPVIPIWLTVFSMWWPVIITATVFLLYYITYEYFHWCMHDPTGRWFEKTFWFIWINRHHNLHHKNPKTNLNVVLPFADWLLGTLVTEGKKVNQNTKQASLSND